ncbi:MAG: TlpA family protein disulfide reductase [Bacteroidales bacterium]|nr:TlpA family protein disulfide reductase [Bacteroidales bacterium]
MKRIALLNLLALMALSAFGQTNVELVCSFANGAGKRVELRGYSDMLTQTEVLLDSAVAAADGSFTLRCYANYPRLVFLQVERYSQSFYIEPGRRYQVYMPEFDWSLDERQNVCLAPVALPLEFLDLPEGELNLAIMRFEATVDSFVTAHRTQLDRRFKPDRRCMDTLEVLVGARRGDTSGNFLARYMEYRLAEMRLATGSTSRKKLIDKYITDNPIRYHDDEYMRLFFALHERSISRGSKRVPQWRLSEWMRRGALDTFLDSLGLEPLLRNEQVRELAALQALREAYYDKDYDRMEVARMVDLLAQNTKFPDHRTLAEALRASFRSTEREAVLPDFELPDVDRRRVSLASFRGKWVYLGFVRVADPHSLKELETMAHFLDTLAGQHPEVVFLTVSCDREFQKMYHFLKSNRRGAKCRWTWLHFDGDYRLLERYGVAGYPTFVLLDPEGRRFYDYTPAPASGFLLRGPWMKTSDPTDYTKPHFSN